MSAGEEGLSVSENIITNTKESNTGKRDTGRENREWMMLLQGHYAGCMTESESREKAEIAQLGGKHDL